MNREALRERIAERWLAEGFDVWKDGDDYRAALRLSMWAPEWMKPARDRSEWSARLEVAREVLFEWTSDRRRADPR